MWSTLAINHYFAILASHRITCALCRAALFRCITPFLHALSMSEYIFEPVFLITSARSPDGGFHASSVKMSSSLSWFFVARNKARKEPLITRFLSLLRMFCRIRLNTVLCLLYGIYHLSFSSPVMESSSCWGFCIPLRSYSIEGSLNILCSDPRETFATSPN